jgi:hypothetical protein
LVDARLYKTEIASPLRGRLAMTLRIVVYSLKETPFGTGEGA